MTTSGVFSRAARMTVLFVADDEDQRFRYQTLAASEGLGVELAADGHEAIVLANLFSPDVIVLDQASPDLDGVEVARRLRASARTRQIPILVVSADATCDAGATVRAVGREGHLVKSRSWGELVGAHRRRCHEASRARRRPPRKRQWTRGAEPARPDESSASLTRISPQPRSPLMIDEEKVSPAEAPSSIVSESEPRKPRGFAAMNPELVSELARRGGMAAHRAGKAHRFTSEEARLPGRKGGMAMHAKRRVAPPSRSAG